MPKTATTPFLTLAATAALGLLFTSAVHAADLTVTVEGAKPGDGNVMVGVFDSASGFPKVPPKLGQFGSVTQDKTSFVFKDVPPGRYAVSAYQDRNNNQKLDTNMVGMPTEPYGFSRDAASRFGPPTFDYAVVTVEAQSMALTVRVK
jgi:uncharacterized protein (DUF2141 family)